MAVMHRGLRKLRRLARHGLNGVQRIVEVRGGIMLATEIPTRKAAAAQDDRLHRIDELKRLKTVWELPLNVAARRFEQGHVLYCLVDHDELCSYCWVSRSGARNDVFFGRWFRVPEAAVYIWDCATFPAHRNRGYYGHMLEGIQATEPGVTSAYVAVDQLNYVSRRALERAGFSACFRYWGVRILQRRAVCIALWERRFMALNKALARLTDARVSVVD